MASSRTTSCKREELMTSVKSCDVDELIRITKSASGTELCDALAEFSNTHLEDFWESVFSLCTTTFLSEKEMDDDEFAKGMNSVLKSMTDLAQATITALLAQKCDDGRKNSLKVPQPLQETIILMHGMFPNIEDGQALKNQMSRLFEECWSHHLDGRQEFATNTIFYLLTRSTQPKSSQSDVSRVWSMRGMLECVTFKENEGSQLVSLLQQCTHHPQFMATNHGIKFLAFLLTLDLGLMANLHKCIKNVIFTTPKSWHSKYGDVYFRSWQIASDSMRQEIEESCIQDLMFRAVHACRQGPHCASAALFRLMSHFHKQKTQRGVESMLVRLYAPILWRSLKVTNSDVRLNAASLMFNVFPLQDPNHHREEADTALQRQFDIINSLLSDPVIEIRVTAVLGIGRVLGMYWEMIPVQVIQCMVTSLVQDMIYDTASPAVREAVLKVMYQLCDNHLCIPMLKKVLPELGNFIHDSSEKVRVAMLDLLLKVKGLRAIKYWSIVPIDHILARLETDSRFVVRRIMSLISSSFVPINQPPSQQVERCLALISSNRGAARQFFLNLPKSLGVVDTVKYILVLCRYALESSRLWTKSGHLQSEDKNEDKEEESDVGRKPRTVGKKRRPGRNGGVSVDTEEEDESSTVERRGSSDASQTDPGDEVLFNMDLLSGLMEGVYLMFTSIVSELSSSEHVAMKEGLMKKLSVTVRELIRISQDPLLEEALVGLAGHLPSRILPVVSQSLFNKLKRNISKKDILDSDLNVDLATVVKALVQWGRTGEMLGMVQDAIVGFLEKEISSVSKGAKRSPKGSKKVAFDTEELSLDVEKTLEILNAMISHAECRPILMNKHKKGIASLLGSLEKGTFKKLEMHLKLLADSPKETAHSHEKKKAPPSDLESELSITLQIFSTYLRLSVFLCLKPNNGKKTDEADDDHDDNFSEIGLSNLKSCLGWILKVILPPLQSTQRLSQSVNVASQLVGMTLKACSGIVMVGVNDTMVFDKAGDICMIIMKHSFSSLTNILIENVLDIAYQITQIRQGPEDGTEQMEEGQETGQDKVMTSSPSKFPLQFALEILESSFKHLASMSRESTSDNLKDSRPLAPVHSSMKELFWALVRPRENPEMFQKTVTVVANLTIQEMEKMSQQDVMDDSEGLPWLANLLTCVKKSSKTLESFVEEVTDHLASDRVNIHSLHGIVSLTKHLKTNLSDSVNPDLEQAINNCLKTISPNGMDEDVFRDVKGQVEQQISEWTGSR